MGPVNKEQEKRLKTAYLGGPAKRAQADAVHRRKIPEKPEDPQTPSAPQTTTNIFEAFIFFLVISLAVGWVYWGVLAWQLGSWLMVLGLVLFPVSAVLGFWSLVFGTPEWVFYIFY